MRKVKIADPTPLWRDQFKEEKKKIKAILGKNHVSIHHIGSTAVTGLKAQPIIDMIAVVKEISMIDGQCAGFTALGYEYKEEDEIPERRVFIKSKDECTYQIYIFDENSKTDIERYIAFRDYLENHSKTAREYAELKEKLAQEFSDDYEKYCAGKEEFIKVTEADAVKWKKKQNGKILGMLYGMVIGLAIGTGFGTLIGNLSMGMCYGICFGMLIGFVRGVRR